MRAIVERVPRSLHVTQCPIGMARRELRASSRSVAECTDSGVRRGGGMQLWLEQQHSVHVGLSWASGQARPQWSAVVSAVVFVVILAAGMEGQARRKGRAGHAEKNRAGGRTLHELRGESWGIPGSAWPFQTTRYSVAPLVPTR